MTNKILKLCSECQMVFEPKDGVTIIPAKNKSKCDMTHKSIDELLELVETKK